MIYNRMVQLINNKLELMQDWEQKDNPDVVVPLTTKQIRERGLNNGIFRELSIANVKKLPIETQDHQRDSAENMTSEPTHSRMNS